MKTKKKSRGTTKQRAKKRKRIIRKRITGLSDLENLTHGAFTVPGVMKKLVAIDGGANIAEFVENYNASGLGDEYPLDPYGFAVVYAALKKGLRKPHKIKAKDFFVWFAAPGAKRVGHPGTGDVKPVPWDTP